MQEAKITGSQDRQFGSEKKRKKLGPKCLESWQEGKLERIEGWGNPEAWVLEQQQVRIPGSLFTLFLFLFSIRQKRGKAGTGEGIRP